MKMSVTNEEMSGGPGGGGGSPPTPTGTSVRTTMTEDVVKSGYLRKLKGKKKFFVLHRETEGGGQARLEYYANERKFRMGHLPKKSIILKHCFNINRTDSKCKFAIALHTRNDCVRIAMNSEEEVTEWLRLLNLYAGDEEDHGREEPAGPGPASSQVLSLKPHFEHVWLVTALNKGLGSKENIIGPYRLCLTSKELTLLKVGDFDEKNSVIKFPLNVIRAVSHDTTFGCFFHIEFGRLAVTGPGQLSLKTEDNNIAQNMHLLILKAMQNYSKEDLVPSRDGGNRRGRTYTWNSESPTGRGTSFHSQTPPVMNRLNSMDGGSAVRIRTESMGSVGMSMSPPMPIHTPPPSISFSPLCSTTDSASSSYSVDYENNNGQNGHARLLSLMSSSLGLDPYAAHGGDDDDDESYVPFNPSEGNLLHQQPSSLTLSLQPLDTADYVETTVGEGRRRTPVPSGPAHSSYMDMQSPLSPYENDYMPMSPGSANPGGQGSLKSGLNSVGGKVSVSHSRNSSLIEETESGYVAMIPGAHHNSSHSHSESGACSTAGSTTGLDEAYLDMDFSRKLNMSNEDMRRMSPTSTESLQSGTPSSDYPLEKVSSYLLPSDDLDDSSYVRPVRAYSVGSRSETGATTKGRYGKNRLEAVQETFRLRALSVGARNPRAKQPIPNLFSPGYGPAPAHGSSSSVSSVPLSSSWSGSTGRWPQTRPHVSPATSAISAHSHQNSEPADSDLMELDFSHNRDKKGSGPRKRSLPGPGLSTPTSGTKISPCPRGILESPEGPSYMQMGPPPAPSPKYTSSAPISIQKRVSTEEPAGGVPLLTRMTGLDLKTLKSLDTAEGAYFDMNFEGPQGAVPLVVKPNENVVPAPFSLNSIEEASPVTAGGGPTPWAFPPTKPDSLTIPPASAGPGNTATSPGLSRIEESPEKQVPRRALGQAAQTGATVTYAALEHLPPVAQKPTSPLPVLASANSGGSCGQNSKYPPITAVTYSQIDFVKSGAPEPVKNN